MKHDTHPRYEPVVFRDRSTGDLTLIRSTISSDQTITYQGKDYPLVNCDITSASHPFWTGHAREIDTEGRIQKFRRRYGNKGSTK